MVAVSSLRTRLLALWLMLATSAGVTGYLLLEFYQQTANAQVSRAEDAVDGCPCCRTIYHSASECGSTPQRPPNHRAPDRNPRQSAPYSRPRIPMRGKRLSSSRVHRFDHFERCPAKQFREALRPDGNAARTRKPCSSCDRARACARLLPS
jgi:hypothetical protein